MMFIAIHVHGEELHRWCPSDFNLEMPPPADKSFETTARAKEEFAGRFLDQFRLHMQPMLHCITYYDLYLVFESKANAITLYPHQMREFDNEIAHAKQRDKSKGKKEAG